MKPLSVSEVQNLAFDLKTLEGSRLQEVRLFGPWLALGFYAARPVWVLLDLNPNSPQVIWLDSLNDISVKEIKKPIVLFLRAHLLGHRLVSVTAPLAFGRVFIFDFGDGRSVEVRLFPGGQNVIVRSAEKQLSYAKPLLLKPLEEIPEIIDVESGLLTSKSEAWRQEKLSKKKFPADVGHPTEEELSRKKKDKILKAIRKIEDDLQLKKQKKWAEVGEWLKAHQTFDGPEEYQPYIDRKATIFRNVENCFREAKNLKKKIEGAKTRIRDLQRDLDQLETHLTVKNDSTPASHDRPEAPSLFVQAQAKGRTFELPGDLTFFVGKSAEDNLRLLRQAKPWYYWLHLRDQPGAYGIVRRNKNQKISDALFHNAAHFLIAKNFGEKHSRHIGEKFAILVAECRFVRPIKGDRLGRVTYSQERSLIHLYRSD